MTSHLNSHRTTDIKPEMLSGVQTGNGTPHDIYNIRGIAHARTNRKDDIFMQRRLVQNFTFILEWGQGTCLLTKHTLRWAYSRYFPPACCLLRFAAFFIYFLAFSTHPFTSSPTLTLAAVSSSGSDGSSSYMSAQWDVPVM